MSSFQSNLLNQTIVPKDDFIDPLANYFFLSELECFDTNTLEGVAIAKRYRRKVRLSFNQEMLPFEEAQGWEFPDAYGNDKRIKFKISLLTERVFRIVFDVSITGKKLVHDLAPMIEDTSLLEPNLAGWTISQEEEITICSNSVKITIRKQPFRLIVSDSFNNTLFDTVSIHEKEGLMNDNPIPFGFIQKTGNKRRQICMSSRISYDEKFYGCGESFTRLNKRGQVVNLSSCDTKGVCTENMYKPVPFYYSSKGYGCFIASSCPSTIDFGHSYDGVTTIYTSEDILDLMLFQGTLKEVLKDYTSFTGRSPILPEWSFGLWMGRITYRSQKEVLDIARKLKEYDIPCSVIHIDTGWFSEEWKCDFKFSEDRFPNVKEMLRELHEEGFHVSLWQLPYFTPQNPLFDYLTDNNLHISGIDREQIVEDAILDFTNPKTKVWYENNISKLLSLGIDAIKTDFGEAAPYNGLYCNGKSGLEEHNLYPLRYQKIVSDITKSTNNHPLIWARSAWAGSQRYPVHWGGDAENTNCAMASSLRAGLSLGICGFTYWSHDIGGFVNSPDPDLYLRWLAFGMFTSHARCHGNPPKEPWEFPGNFTSEFRRIVKIRSGLLPYILEEAQKSSENGWPMMRTLFFENPEDYNCWNIDDEYYFGSELLVAPLFESNATSRYAYLPKGYIWEDYFSGTTYKGGDWYNITTENYIVVLKKGDSYGI